MNPDPAAPAAWQAALSRLPGDTWRKFHTPLRTQGSPTPLVSFSGYLWYLEDHGLWAVPLSSDRQAELAQHARISPDWSGTTRVADADRPAPGQWLTLGGTAHTSRQLADVLAALGVPDPDLRDPEPVIRHVHATVYAEVDDTGRIRGWRACEPGSEPIDSTQGVWNTATEEWERPDTRAERVWHALGDLLDAGHVDPLTDPAPAAGGPPAPDLGASR